MDVIVPTYNDNTALRLVLEGYLRQTEPHFTLHIVNDGGSRSAIKLVHEYKRHLLINYQYLNPFKPPEDPCRLAKARNLGLRFCEGSRVLFTDGDCIPHPHLIKEHRFYEGEPLLIAGIRRNITQVDTNHLKSQGTLRELENASWESDLRISDPKWINLGELAAYTPQPIIRRGGLTTVNLAWGCHVSFPTKLIKQIGGFWEELIGWGGEDAELTERFIKGGGKILYRPDLWVYHLHHQPLTQQWMRIERKLRESRSILTLLRNGEPIP